jgi:hypothetical protein
MRMLLVLALAGVAAYYFFPRDNEPVEITDPVYAEIRIEMPIGSRQIDFVLFGKMASDEDCRLRANLIWEKMIQGCAACTIGVSACKKDLEPRYQRLFNDVSINTAYLSFTRGEPGERDGRMVIWGVTTEEGNAFCDQASQQFKTQYKGVVTCVVGAAE